MMAIARRIPSILVIVAAMIAVTSRDADAQQRPRPTRNDVNRSVALQAEFASVLLQAGRYGEAAREFRALIARSPRNVSYRLNLARALEWGERHAEAEPLLRALRREMPRDAEVLALLHSARANLEPSASDAVSWLGEEPDYSPYRVALARALVRDQHPRLAIEQYERLLAMSQNGDTAIPPASMLRRELTDAYAAAKDRAGGIRVTRAALVTAPTDTSLRRTLAGLLAADRQYDAALSEYDALLAMAPSAELFTDRARVHLARSEAAAARADLTSSLAIAPSVDAYFLLGGLHREAGDYKEARHAYEAARALERDRASSGELAAAIAQLAREERPAVALVTIVGDDPGWTTSVDGASDNLGIQVVNTTVRRSSRLGSMIASLGVESAALRDASALNSTSLAGGGASIGLSRELASGPVLARLGFEAGMLKLNGVQALPEGSLAAALWQGAWQGTVSIARGAAYRSLFTAATLMPGAGEPLTEESMRGAIAGPAGAADLAISVERSRFSDGNVRVTLQAYSRYPLSSNVFAVYSGTSQQFADRSTRYWDPLMYSAHALGLELSSREVRGFSYAIRVLPGVAATREVDRRAHSVAIRDATAGEVVRRTALTLGTSGDAIYRTRDWEMAGALTFGRGRAGDYQRLGATVTVRRALGAQP